MIEMRGLIGKTVMFGVTGDDAVQVMLEAAFYAEQYRDEGDVRIQQKIDGRWKNSGKVSHRTQ